MEAPDPRVIDRTVEACTAAHQRLLQIADGLTEDEVRAPSLLPGWSRGHVLNHLRRNADSFTGLCTAAAAGGVGVQYPGEPDHMTVRNAGLEDGAHDPAEVLVANLRASIYALEAVWFRSDASMWSGVGLMASGATLPVAEFPFRRLRETVVHMVDLDTGYTHEDWPDLYVRMELERQRMAWAASHPMGLTQLPARAQELPEKLRVAWLIRRASVEGLPEGPGL